MSVTQYVGARYVPIFADPADWTKQRTYEPLTIVMHEGNSFTSKQFVPKGIELTNEDFWAETGNYNAQVEAYRREVLGLSDTVNGFDGRLTEAEADIVEVSENLNNFDNANIATPSQIMTSRAPNKNTSLQGFAMVSASIFAMGYAAESEDATSGIMLGNMNTKEIIGTFDFDFLTHAGAMYFENGKLYVANYEDGCSIFDYANNAITFDRTVYTAQSVRSVGKIDDTFVYLDDNYNVRNLENDALLFALEMPELKPERRQAFTFYEGYILGAFNNRNTVLVFDTKGKYLNSVQFIESMFVSPNPEIEQIAFWGDKFFINRNANYNSSGFDYGFTGKYHYFDIYAFALPKQISSDLYANIQLLSPNTIYCNPNYVGKMDGTRNRPFNCVALAIQYAEAGINDVTVIDLQNFAYQEIILSRNSTKKLIVQNGTVDGVSFSHGNYQLQNIQLTDNAISVFEASYNQEGNLYVNSAIIKLISMTNGKYIAYDSIVKLQGNQTANTLYSLARNIIIGNQITFANLHETDIVRTTAVIDSIIPPARVSTFDIVNTSMADNVEVNLRSTLMDNALVEIFLTHPTKGTDQIVKFYSSISAAQGNTKTIYGYDGQIVGKLTLKQTVAVVDYDNANDGITINRIRAISG